MAKRGPDFGSQILIGILVLVAFFWLMQLGKAPMQVLDRRDCENRYAQARTAADSLTVDSMHSPLAKGPTTMTCGSLRHAGALR